MYFCNIVELKFNILFQTKKVTKPKKGGDRPQVFSFNIKISLIFTSGHSIKTFNRVAIGVCGSL